MPRDRAVNFTRDETYLLVTICRKHRDVLNNKKSDNLSLNIKNKAWEEIAAEFNQKTGGNRTEKTLKNRFHLLKVGLRKKILEQRNQALSGFEKLIQNNFLETFDPVEKNPIENGKYIELKKIHFFIFVF